MATDQKWSGPAYAEHIVDQLSSGVRERQILGLTGVRSHCDLWVRCPDDPAWLAATVRLYGQHGDIRVLLEETVIGRAPSRTASGVQGIVAQVRGRPCTSFVVTLSGTNLRPAAAPGAPRQRGYFRLQGWGVDGAPIDRQSGTVTTPFAPPQVALEPGFVVLAAAGDTPIPGFAPVAGRRQVVTNLVVASADGPLLAVQLVDDLPVGQIIRREVLVGAGTNPTVVVPIAYAGELRSRAGASWVLNVSALPGARMTASVGGYLE